MNSYYHNTIGQFLLESDDQIIGKLTNQISHDYFQQLSSQNISWANFIENVKQEFANLVQLKPVASGWSILLEYKIPRIAKRIDMVIIANDLIFVIEYKDSVGSFDNSYKRQLEDYCLDLRDFHKESFNKTIVPILYMAEGHANNTKRESNLTDPIKPVIYTNTGDFASSIYHAFQSYCNPAVDSINPTKWNNSDYNPTPTIVQAAQSLFAGQGVENITKSHADSQNLTTTTDTILNAINRAKSNSEKLICFVTGVPGAGKTLVGLNIVHKEELFEENKTLAAYFSGNGPLIKVLREALTRDKYDTEKAIAKKRGSKTPVKEDIKRKVNTHIQNLHNFISDLYRSEKAPPEKIAVFDEAQRCWNAEHFYNKNNGNKNRNPNALIIRKSEPHLLLDIMDRHRDWAVMVALVGGGQEINTGEAGIGEWGRVVSTHFPHWKVMVSPELLQGDDSVAGNKLFKSTPSNVEIKTTEDLHLKVSQRSYKAKSLSAWINAVLRNEPFEAKSIIQPLLKDFPVVLTRNLDTAKDWLRTKQSGTRRIGLISSSGALRLKPYGLNVKESMDEPKWFLNKPEDVRSSYFLEIPATEFAIQGLEIGWSGLCWDLDLRRNDGQWDFKKFVGTKWNNVNKEDDRLYTLNKYRVLLSRAREGMIIWIPDGSADPLYGKKEDYDAVAEYLTNCGLETI
ncbi:DNA/RNA helicase domain-containing protein [Owenweeksia hongkongensis]|uniref:DNA/RNA helicase domain-containing protein n=1 Tax=Owenweeksia hongkongensis TaxID=253245 RepID=UPI003A92981C